MFRAYLIIFIKKFKTMAKEISATDAVSKSTIELDYNHGNINVGGHGTQGDIGLKNPEGNFTVHIDGGNGNITLGGHGSEGDVTLNNTEGKCTVHIDGGNGNITLGGFRCE